MVLSVRLRMDASDGSLVDVSVRLYVVGWPYRRGFVSMHLDAAGPNDRRGFVSVRFDTIGSADRHGIVSVRLDATGSADSRWFVIPVEMIAFSSYLQ